MSIAEGQKPEGELLGPVKDYGESAGNPFLHLYQTSINIGYHCAATDIVSLLFLHPVKSGAQSRVGSNVTLFNALL